MGDIEHPNIFPWSAGLPDGVENEFITIPWNNLELLQKIVQHHHHEIAAIITEPIMCNSGCILPEEGFLQGIRDLCDTYDITCIFDEVITGFRTSLGGVQALYNITPDLSIFAKAMASGYPISAIVGKKEWMNLIVEGKVIHAGTMNSSCSTVAAALGTIEVLEQKGIYENIYHLGLKLMNGLKEIGKKKHSNLLVQGLGPMVHTGFTDLPEVKDFRDVMSYDKVKLGKFVAGMHDKGIRIIGRGLWYISTVHTESEIDKTLEIAEEVLWEV